MLCKHADSASGNTTTIHIFPSGANVRTEDNVRQEDRETQRKVRYWFFWTRTVTELVKVDVHYKEDVLMFNPRKIKVCKLTLGGVPAHTLLQQATLCYNIAAAVVVCPHSH